MASTKQEDSTCCTATAWEKIQQADNDDAGSYEGIDMRIGDVDVPVYLTGSPSASDKAIVIFPDIYGISNRTRAIADTMAAKGYHVMVIDCFHGETIVGKPDKKIWLSKFTYESVSKDIMAGFEYLAKEKGVNTSQISGIGFCWGGWAIAKSSSEGIGWKCAVSPHPSTKIERVVFGRDEEMMLSKVSMPFLLLAAGDDAENMKPGSEVVKNLEEKGGSSVLFDSMRHGWVTRGDLSVPGVKEDAEKALTLTLNFIVEHC